MLNSIVLMLTEEEEEEKSVYWILILKSLEDRCWNVGEKRERVGLETERVRILTGRVI